MPMTRILAAAVAVLLMAGTAVASEVNPVLPFWSRPFPDGYAAGRDVCVQHRRIRTSHGFRTRVVDNCRAVVSVYD